jgi:hypothetical protein
VAHPAPLEIRTLKGAIMVDTTSTAGPPPGGPLPSPAQMAQMPLSWLVQVLGLGNVMKVDDVIGMTGGRVFLFAIWSATSGFILVPLGARVMSLVTTWETLWVAGGTLLWLFLISPTLPLFLVYVREDVAFIGVNALGGRQHVFKTGLNIKFPTESVHHRNFIDLTLAEISETVTYNSKDGARYIYRYLVLYRPSVSRLPIYRAVKEEDIEREVQAIVRSALSLETLSYTSDQLGSREIAGEIERRLREDLGQMGDAGHELEYRFGIDIINVSLSEPTPDKDIIEANQANVVALKVRKSIETLRGQDKDLSAQEAANLAAMLNKENVSKQVHSYEYGNIPAVLESTIKYAVDRVVERLGR